MGYFVGLDLGQSKDYTALTVLEVVTAPLVQVVTGRTITYEPSKEPPALHVRHLERFPLGTRYPKIVVAVQERLAPLRAMRADTALVVDKTGVGAPVVDLFTEAGLEPIPITITAGTEPTPDGAGWHVPKRDLVSTLQVVLQAQRLKVAESLPEAATLTRELLNFKVKITLAANDVYGAGADWRVGKHDDLVLAVAMAVWYREHGYWPPWTSEEIRRAFDWHAQVG